MCFISGLSKVRNVVSEHLNVFSEQLTVVSKPVNGFSEVLNAVSKPVNSVCEVVNVVSKPLNVLSADLNGKSGGVTTALSKAFGPGWGKTEEHAMDNFESESSRDLLLLSKPVIWKRLCSEVQSRIGRPLADYEKNTFAAALEWRFRVLEGKEDLLKSLFDVETTDSIEVVCLKIHQGMNRFLVEMYAEMYMSGGFGEYTGQRETERREGNFQKLKNESDTALYFAELAVAEAESSIPLPGIPGFLIPAWILSIQ